MDDYWVELPESEDLRLEEANSGLILRRKRRILAIYAIFCAIFVPTFLYFGLQPEVNQAEAYAAEVATATSALSIPQLGLDLPVASVQLVERNLTAPEYIAGAYHSGAHKIFIIGHSATAFADLPQINLGDTVIFDEKAYVVSHMEVQAKAEIDMAEILADTPADQLILMTCAGESLGGQDYSHRLIVWAD